MKKTEQERDSIRRAVEMSEEGYYTRPVGDARRWFKEQAAVMGMTWSGPEPEEFTDIELLGESKGLKDVLFGRRKPRTTPEKEYLKYMGGVQSEVANPELKKWIKCGSCTTEFVSFGYPGQQGGRMYPTICTSCGDRMNATRRKPNKPKPRSWANDA